MNVNTPHIPKRHRLARASYLCRPALSTAPCSGRPPRSTAPWSSLCPRWAGSPDPSSCCRSPCSSRCAAWPRLTRCCSGWKAAALGRWVHSQMRHIGVKLYLAVPTYLAQETSQNDCWNWPAGVSSATHNTVTTNHYVLLVLKDVKFLHLFIVVIILSIVLTFIHHFYLTVNFACVQSDSLYSLSFNSFQI